MATIRTVLTAAAALCAVAWSMPAPVQAQPLNIVATAKQDSKPVRAKTKKAAATKKASSRKIASSKASKHLRTASGTKKTRTARAQTTKRIVGQRPPAPPMEPDQAFAHAPEGHVMRGADSVSLIARLPWWRNDRMQTIHYGSEQAQSQVLAAAEAWLANSDVADDAFDSTVGGGTMRLASADNWNAMARATDALPKADSILIADAAQFNDIDQVASQASPSPLADRSVLHSILAMLGGALAAAASARFLFV